MQGDPPLAPPLPPQGGVMPQGFAEQSQPIRGGGSYVSLPMGYGVPMVSPEEWEARNQQNQTKKEIRRISNGLGAGLLFVQGIGTVLTLLLPFLIELVFPGSVEGGGVFYDSLLYALYAPVSILLSMWLGLKIAKGSIEELVPFGKTKPLLWFSLILFSFFFVFVGNLAGDAMAWLFPHTMENLNAAMGNEPTTPMELLVGLLQMAAIPALVEELAFRGIALGVLRKYGDGFAIVVSALLFGMLHGNFIQIPFAFCMGLILGYSVVRTGSIVPAIVIHFINNAMSCLLSYYMTTVGAGGIWFTVFLYALWFVVGVFGFCLLRFCFSEKLLACCTSYAGCLTPGRRTGVFFSGAALIVALVVYGGSAALFALPLGL